MKPFTYATPTSLEAAFNMLQSPGPAWRALGGGQSLLLELKDRTSTPEALMSLRGLPELKGITGGPEGLQIGAMVTYRALAQSTDLNGYGPLGSVARDIADIPVRTMATVGGALCQADPRFDMPVVLQALNAQVELKSPDGERTISLGDFIVGPRRTGLRAGELLVRIHLPKTRPNLRWTFHKFRTREMDTAVVSVTAAAEVAHDAVLRNPAIVVGGCLTKPRRLAGVERVLEGSPVTEEVIAEAAEAVRAEIEPDVSTVYFDADYKRHLAGVLLQRALRDIAHRNPSGE